MLSRTTLSGTQALLHLALTSQEGPITPARIGERLGLSPSYMAKIARTLTRANILRAFRGAKGGVSLSRPPEQITLLEIVEATQGQLFRDFQLGEDPDGGPCALLGALRELELAVRQTLSRWTLADLAANPCPTMAAANQVQCLITGSQGADAPVQPDKDKTSTDLSEDGT